jgi:hypothetical protein
MALAEPSDVLNVFANSIRTVASTQTASTGQRVVDVAKTSRLHPAHFKPHPDVIKRPA